MSELESIAKLREWSHRHDNGWIQKDGSIVIQADTHGVRYGDNYGEAIRSMIDEIEREVDERFMELPVDADGVPIHVGNLIEFGDKGERLEVTHIGWTKHGDPTIAYRRPNGTLDCSCIGTECRHVKPRTIEDVLRDVWKEALDYANSAIWRNPDEVFAERANEIRELMEVKR